jgi:tryptophan 2,3-dioxygenase
MNADEGDCLKPETVWPQRTGVAGISLHAATASYSQRLATIALDAVAAWVRSADTHDLAGRPAEFPFADVLDHYRAVGRLAASTSLVGELGQLAKDRTGTSTQLALWLRATTDQFDGDYHTYAGLSLHMAWLDEAPLGTRQRSAEILMLSLLVDLLRTESEALAAAPAPAQRKRTRAVVHALRRIDQLAPQAAAATPDLPTALDAIRAGASDEQLAELAMKAAMSADVFPETAQLINLTLLPATVLHDELMFLRSIQVFECLYLLGAWHIEAATTTMRGGDPDTATALLRDTAQRFESALALYRVLTTMPKASFAIIRKYTAGRSAIQSHAFRQVEHASSPVADDDPARRTPRADRPTMQEEFLRARDRLPAEVAERLLVAMLRVDAGWRALKRSHWGITLKTIGQVAGTGGTTGADYLYQTSQLPLFPALS